MPPSDLENKKAAHRAVFLLSGKHIDTVCPHIKEQAKGRLKSIFQTAFPF
ncbi:hypothetical protein [Kingella potus]|nr:hypothetical protein [Kingella potus]UOP01757.1 hypothetical protein LVJ84_06500 [Kingella potus]